MTRRPVKRTVSRTFSENTSTGSKIKMGGYGHTQIGYKYTAHFRFLRKEGMPKLKKKDMRA
jgi:hypothetical protein